MTFDRSKFVVNDCETYPNYFLAAFKNIDSGQMKTIELCSPKEKLSDEQRKLLKSILSQRITFGFNSLNFDLPLLLYALQGATCEQIYDAAMDIIENGLKGWQIMQKLGLQKPANFLHFDIAEPTPGVKVSLKLYGGRINSKRLQDLPIEPGTTLTKQQMEDTKLYCVNDLDTTIDLFNKIEDRMKLRYDMAKGNWNSPIISKSDAQIAEVVLKDEIKKKSPRVSLYPPKIAKDQKFKYNAPSYIKFESKQLKDALDFIKTHHFELDGKGSIKLPSELKNMKIEMGISKYQLGIGGLHSNEKKQTIIPMENQYLIDKDVAAYYPSIILNLSLYPKHLGPVFLSVYQDVVNRRLAAKKAGDKVTDSSLKILINGSFGKLGSKYSALYSPDLMMTVTLTGQLALLMLIEQLEKAGISVVSANTDGFVSLFDKKLYDVYSDICFNWELDTGFTLEETHYKALYSRDVNNYLAIKTDNKAKGKGIFTLDELQKNPQAPISIEAVIEYLKSGTPITKTITNCHDVTRFLTVRSVTGGAVWKTNYLGRVVRWVYSKKGEPITYKKNGNKVAMSDGAWPVMELEKIPSHIDYDRYIKESVDVLEDIGALSL